IIIVSDAYDTKGLSMDDNFEVSFFTRPHGSRPRVLSVFPVDDDTVFDRRMPVVITFSDPVDPITCRNSITMSPSMAGSWSVDSGGTQATFTPSDLWTMGTTYYVTVPADFTSSIGISTGREFKSRFTVGDDKTPPELLAAYAVDDSGVIMFSLIEDSLGGGGAENPNWESSYSLRLDFSEPVNTDTVKNSITVVSAGSLELQSTPGFLDSVIFSFSEKPVYLSRFDIKIGPGIEDQPGNKSTKNYVYKFFADGVNSKPPALIGIRLPLAPGESNPNDWDPAVYAVGDLFADLPIEDGAAKYTFDTAIPTWIELYFDTAPGASLDLFSIMDLFSISSTNTALSFSFRAIKDSGFSWGAPHSAWSSYTRVEVQGRLTNYGSSGVVTIKVGNGVLDTYGNRNDNDIQLILLK
ncbi:Ig-like domain-containing protein, partial [Treponema sp. OttesenSCG-928-L16]|nr:Ig-like domain-containing protein [Treponema sp. OttesenSCG-928-L16]